MAALLYSLFYFLVAYDVTDHFCIYYFSFFAFCDRTLS